MTSRSGRSATLEMRTVRIFTPHSARGKQRGTETRTCSDRRSRKASLDNAVRRLNFTDPMSKLDPLRQAVAVSPENVPLLLLLAHACLDEWSLEEGRALYEKV